MGPNKLLLGMAFALAASSAMAQTPAAPPKLPKGAETLGWMQGARVHTNADGKEVREAFLGPVNGYVTGTALSDLGDGKVSTEYHKIGLNADGVYGLDVANTGGGMKWNFTPLKAIDPDSITFQSADGTLTISYTKAPGNGVDAKVIRITDGKSVTREWHFKPVK